MQAACIDILVVHEPGRPTGREHSIRTCAAKQQCEAAPLGDGQSAGSGCVVLMNTDWARVCTGRWQAGGDGRCTFLEFTAASKFGRGSPTGPFFKVLEMQSTQSFYR